MNHGPWRDKRVFITGVCGTIGRELLRQVLLHQPREIVGIDNNEAELFFLIESYRSHANVHLYLGDVRDREKMRSVLAGMDIVLHSAALKHVVLCEESPSDAVQTNILGTQNIIDAAQVGGAERVIFTSSDKAVNPTNVMGTTKLMGERIITAANAHKRTGGPVFFSSRFGNVLGSRGSVVPLFRRQIAAGGPVTITHPDMTRFIMTLENAVALVMDSVFLAKGGEVFVTKMPVARISDLAAILIEELAPRLGHRAHDIETRIIGTKPGEKLYEELVNEEEIRRTVDVGHYFVVTPAFRSVYNDIEYAYAGGDGRPLDRPYNSSVEAPLTRDELRAVLAGAGFLGEAAP
jgi:FlaA1/EpsC-like NDP-sugar epimerase